MAVNRKPGKREMLEKALGQESIPTEYPEHTSSIRKTRLPAVRLERSEAVHSAAAAPG